MLTQNSRVIISRIYLSICILLYFICTLLFGINFYKAYGEFTSELNIYSKILELTKKDLREIENNPKCKSPGDSKPLFECTIPFFDSRRGTYADSDTPDFNKVSFEELSEPTFPWVQFWWLLGCIFVLPILLFLLKKWVVWVTNSKEGVNG
jgi:hypothetical protein